MYIVHLPHPPPPPSRVRPLPPSPPRPSLSCSATQARIVRQNWFKLGSLMTINGGLAAAASYLVGWGLQQAVGGTICL